MTVLCFFPFLPAYLVSISPNLVFSILVWSLTLTKEAFLKCLVIFGYSSYLRMGSCELYCKDIRLGHFTEEILFFFFNKFIYLFLAVLGLRCCARVFSSCSERGLLFIAVRGLLTAVASLVAEHGL